MPSRKQTRKRKDRSGRVFEFICTRCGSCCKKPIGPMMGKIHGLMILPEERLLFPKEIVKPMFRYSERYRLLPGLVFMYQVDAEPCPHYVSDEEGCAIYSKRPLICRCFPFEPKRSGGVAMHESCPEIARLIAAGYKPNEVRFSERYLPSMIRVINYWDMWLKTTWIERYDIKEKEWAFIMDGVKKEYLEGL